MSLRLTKVIRGFTEGARFDWLHPSHGPLPDFAAEYRDGDDLYEVLAWDDGGYSWVTMVCGPDHIHGGYPISYRWWPRDDDTIWCKQGKGSIYDVDIKPNGSLIRQVAVASIHMHIMSEPWPEGWG